MFKAIHLVQNLPHDKTNPNFGRFLILEDTETGERTELPFQENCLSAVFRNQIFDIYGRELEVDPNITQILNKAGRWVGANTDAEAYFVMTTNGKICIAYVSYYFTDPYGSRQEVYRYAREYNPLFQHENYRSELVCTDLEAIDVNILKDPEFLSILNPREKLILIKRDAYYSLHHPGWISDAITYDIFKEKTDVHPAWKGGNYFLSCSCANGKISATTKASREDPRQIISIKTDADFISQHCLHGCLLDNISFYLAK